LGASLADIAGRGGKEISTGLRYQHDVTEKRDETTPVN
jgi:hypothetical protein